jgi:hypothetical protein
MEAKLAQGRGRFALIWISPFLLSPTGRGLFAAILRADALK